MKAIIDIENARNRNIVSIELNVTEYIEDKIIKFDLSKLDVDMMNILKLAISENPNNNYIDIELFYIDDSSVPEFGPDYDFYIKDDLLIGIYNRNIYIRGGNL